MSIILNHSITVKKKPKQHDSGEIKIINAAATEEYAPTWRVSDKYGPGLNLTSKEEGTGAHTDLKQTERCLLDGKAGKEEEMAEPRQANWYCSVSKQAYYP